MNEAARMATETDLPLLCRFYAAGHAEMSTLKPAWAILDARPEPVEESFALDLADPDAVVLIGVIDGAPVGYAAVRTCARLPQAGGVHARVGDIWVEPEARAVGVGEELISAALDWARARGASSAEIRVLPGHRHAKNFCEENGFTARLLVMHRDL